MGLLDAEVGLKAPIVHGRQLEAVANRMLKRKKVRRGIKRRPIPRMTYRAYIASDYWRKRKLRYFGKFGKRCKVCGQKAGTTLHHKVYDPKVYGREPDEALVALCPHHHRDYHRHFGVQADMMETTDLFIQHERQMVAFEKSTDWLETLTRPQA